jgi:hypothetical protein
MNRYDEITGKLGVISVDIAKLSSKFATASAEELESLTDKLTKLEDKKRGYLTALAAMRQAERDERDAAENLARETECKRKAKLSTKVQKEGSVCPKCGSPGIVIDDPPQPNGYSNTFWTQLNAPKMWWLEFTCTQEPQIKCGHRWKIFPDAPEVVPSGV